MGFEILVVGIIMVGIVALGYMIYKENNSL